MLRFLKISLPLAVLALCLTCGAVSAQVTETPSDTVVKKKQKRAKRETLLSDSLPSVLEQDYKKEESDSVKPKKRRRQVDAAYYESPHQAVEPDTPTDTVVKPKRQKKSKRDTTLRTETLDYNGNVDAGIDTSTTETVKPKRERKPRRTDTLYQADFDTVPHNAPAVPLTREQQASQLFDQGNYFLEKGGNFEALQRFDSLVTYYPNTFPHKLGYYFRGVAKMNLGNDKGAETDFRFFNQVDQCNSNLCTDAHYNLALIKFRGERYDEALTELQYVLKDSTYKNHKYGFFYRAFCRAQQQQFIPAIQDLTTFINLDGTRTFSSAEALYYRGFYKAKMQDNRGAIADYDKAVALYETGLNTKNGAQYKQKLIDTYIVRALAKAEIKKYDDAIADYNVVIKLNPNFATAYRLKGLAEIGKGDVDAGCLDLSRAGELGAVEAYDDIKQHCR